MNGKEQHEYFLKYLSFLFFKKVIRVCMKAYFGHKIKNHNWGYSSLNYEFTSIFWEKSQSSYISILWYKLGLRWGKLIFWVKYCFNSLVFLRVVHHHKFYSVWCLMFVCLNDSHRTERLLASLLCIYQTPWILFAGVTMRIMGQMPVWPCHEKAFGFGLNY